MNKISLNDISCRAPEEFNKQETKKKIVGIIEELNELQNLLYAQSKHAVLVVIQGMDASGKDGTIRNVFGTLNPQGVTVKSFKTPTEDELAHDFLWRVHKATPAQGMIQIFNRSHYEDVLITRVHKWCDDETAFKRMKAINNFEELLQEHGNTHILKFYLHVSAEEQKLRLDERIHDPRKQWKYNENDYKQAALREEYLRVYEDCFLHCNTVPWHIIPSDQNWYKEYLIATELHKLLTSLDMIYPGLKKS